MWPAKFQQIATLGFLVYVIFLLGRSARVNAERNQTIRELEASIAALQEENAYLENLIVYVQTDSFRELEARRKLGLKKPGELVIALPPEPGADASTPEAQDPAADARPLPQIWWDYYF